MQQIATFVRDGPLPSYFANAITKALSVITPNFTLVQTDLSHVKVAAGPNDAAAIISIRGLWRWAEADVGPVAHPGGAAGLYPIFVTASAQNVVSSPLPFTDNSDYSFGLQIKAPGATPTIVAGVVDVFRQVGVANWNGARIVGVTQTVPGAAPALPWLPTSRAHRVAALATPQGATTPIAMDSVDWDVPQSFGLGSYICRRNGDYAVTGMAAVQGGFNNHANVTASAWLLKNGVGYSQGSAVNNGGATNALMYSMVHDVIQCAQGDAIALGVNVLGPDDCNLIIGPFNANYLTIEPRC